MRKPTCKPSHLGVRSTSSNSTSSSENNCGDDSVLTLAVPVRIRTSRRGSSISENAASIASPPNSGHPNTASVDNRAELTVERFHVLSDDKLTLTMIPSDLIEPTLGSLRYVQQGAAASFTFRFQLCRAFGQEGRCAHQQGCTFIHSRHVLDPSLRTLVKETAVHMNTPLTGPVENAPYRRLPPGVAIPVYDETMQRNCVVESRHLYFTTGVVTAYEEGAKDLQHPERAPVLPTIRLQFCLHFDRGMCARGEECHFVHRVLVDTPPPKATVITDIPIRHRIDTLTLSSQAPPVVLAQHHSGHAAAEAVTLARYELGAKTSHHSGGFILPSTLRCEDAYTLQSGLVGPAMSRSSIQQGPQQVVSGNASNFVSHRFIPSSSTDQGSNTIQAFLAPTLQVASLHPPYAPQCEAATAIPIQSSPWPIALRF